jgi:hypothetical protein
MESDAGYGILLELGQIITNISHRVTKKKRKTAKKVDQSVIPVVCS